MSHTIVKATGLILLGCLGAYVVNEVRKEYDNCVDENNNLRDFIRDHDFYEKQEPSKPDTVKQTSSKTKYQPVLEKIDEYIDGQGRTVGVYKDLTSGFTVKKIERSSAKENNA